MTVAVAAAETLPLANIAIEGSRYPQPLILQWAGLKPGQQADEAMIAQACGKLQETGLFKAAEYRYSFGPEHTSYSLVLKLTDEPETLHAVIDIPGAAEEVVWEWLRPIVPNEQRMVPGNDAALGFYTRAMEQVLAAHNLRQELATRMGGNIGSAASIRVYFQPKSLPLISSVKFEGARKISSAALEQFIAGMALHTPYSRDRFAQLLDQNIRRLYEEHGYLKVGFTVKPVKLPDGSVAVTTLIDEGRSYQLGRVQVVGGEPAEFPTGQVVNWKEIAASIDLMEQAARRGGYLEVHSSTERSLHDESGILDLKIRLEKGPLYVFGEMKLFGLDATAGKLARSLWSLAPGAPMDEKYPAEFLRGLLDQRDFPRGLQSGAQLKRRPDGRTVDVVLTFH